MFYAGYALERVHNGYSGSIHRVIKNQLAETVAGVVVRECVSRYGYPLEIHTDQARHFESEPLKEMCELLEIGKQGP